MTDTVYTAPPTVARFMRSAALFRLIMGPLGSGKSTGCIMEIARRAKEQAPSKDGLRHTRWAVVRNTKQQLKDTTLKTWLDWFPDGVAGRWKETTMTYTLRFGDVVCEVLFRALDDEADVKQLLSLELTGAYINEAREIPLAIIVGLQSRVDRYPSRKDVPPTWHGIIADTNPPDTDHWIYEKFELEKVASWEIFKQPGGLDPNAENRANLGETYYEDMMAGASKAWIDVHVHAKFGASKAGKPVYEQTFVDDFHVAKEPLLVLRNRPVIVGMDFGRTPAATFEQVDPKGRQLVLDEVYADNCGLERFIDQFVRPKLVERFAGLRTVVCGDPAGWAKSQINEKSCADILKAKNFVAVRAPTNDIDKRLEAVENQLRQQVDGQAMLLVDPRCRRLVTGFKSKYMYRLTRAGTHEVSPHKNEFSHIHDARQYAALCSSFAGNLASLQNTARTVERVNAAGWT